MTFIILNSLALANQLDKSINDYMIKNMKGYNGTQWCKILTDNNGKYAVYIKSKDSRNPFNALTTINKTEIIDKLPDSFYHNKDNLGTIIRAPNYVN